MADIKSPPLDKQSNMKTIYKINLSLSIRNIWGTIYDIIFMEFLVNLIATIPIFRGRLGKLLSYRDSRNLPDRLLNILLSVTGYQACGSFFKSSFFCGRKKWNQWIVQTLS